MAILPLHLAEALHGSREENVVANFQLLRLGNIFMECIILPMWASILVLLVIVIAEARRIPTFHGQGDLLEIEDYLEGEVQHDQDNHKYETTLVKALNRQQVPVFPKNIRRLRCFLYAYLMVQKCLIMLVFAHFDGFVIAKCSVEPLLRLTSNKHRTRRLQFIKH